MNPWKACEFAVGQCIALYGIDARSRSLDGSNDQHDPQPRALHHFLFSNQIELLYGSDDVGYTPAILTHETLCAILE